MSNTCIARVLRGWACQKRGVINWYPGANNMRRDCCVYSRNKDIRTKEPPYHLQECYPTVRNNSSLRYVGRVIGSLYMPLILHTATSTQQYAGLLTSCRIEPEDPCHGSDYPTSIIAVRKVRGVCVSTRECVFLPGMRDDCSPVVMVLALNSHSTFLSSPFLYGT